MCVCVCVCCLSLINRECFENSKGNRSKNRLWVSLLIHLRDTWKIFLFRFKNAIHFFSPVFEGIYNVFRSHFCSNKTLLALVVVVAVGIFATNQNKLLGHLFLWLSHGPLNFFLFSLQKRRSTPQSVS